MTIHDTLMFEQRRQMYEAMDEVTYVRSCYGEFRQLGNTDWDEVRYYTAPWNIEDKIVKVVNGWVA